MSHPRKPHNQSGQVIGLYAIAFLLIALATFLTVAVGVRVRDKIKVQSASDAAAYSMAVSQARAMNMMAMTNRAMIAEYVSAISVVGHESYISEWVGILKMQSSIWNANAAELALECLASCVIPHPGCIPCLNGTCRCISKATKISKMWKSDGFSGSSCPGGGSGSLGSYDCAKSMWATTQNMSKMMHTAATGAATAHMAAAKQAFLSVKLQYQFSWMNNSLASTLGSAIDSRITNGINGSGSKASQHSYKCAIDNKYGSSVTDDCSVNSFADPKRPDWDTYQEILSGTRTDWILRHDFTGGFYDLDLAKEVQIFSQCSGIAGSSSDNVGGGMTQFTEDSGTWTTNTGHTHGFHDASAYGEGGRLSLGAVDKGSTEGFCYVPGCGGCYDSKSGKASAFKDPDVGCHKHSIDRLSEGSTVGSSNSGAGAILPSLTMDIANIAACADAGITAGGFFRFSIRNDEDALWGQPHSYAALRLDVSSTKNPWDFKFGPIGGSILKVDGHDNTGKASLGGFSSGLTYYHNPDETNGWREPPTLWNPFWRAKLHPVDLGRTASPWLTKEVKMDVNALKDNPADNVAALQAIKALPR